jgi:hypothetical protein
VRGGGMVGGGMVVATRRRPPSPIPAALLNAGSRFLLL